jgi:hypothetical protein
MCINKCIVTKIYCCIVILFYFLKSHYLRAESVCIKFLQRNREVSARRYACNCWYADIFVQYVVVLMIYRQTFLYSGSWWCGFQTTLRSARNAVCMCTTRSLPLSGAGLLPAPLHAAVCVFVYLTRLYLHLVAAVVLSPFQIPATRSGVCSVYSVGHCERCGTSLLCGCCN